MNDTVKGMSLKDVTAARGHEDASRFTPGATTGLSTRAATAADMDESSTNAMPALRKQGAAMVAEQGNECG